MRNLAFALLFSLATFGCGDDGGDDMGGRADAATESPDAGSDEPDATVADAGLCVFNSDCPDVQRCDDETGMCEVGERGTGQNGVDTCDSGDDCESAVCAEGPPESGELYCSGECETDDDCTGMLPRCLDVAFLGRMCVREDPGA